MEGFAPKVKTHPRNYNHLVLSNGKLLLAGNYHYDRTGPIKEIIRINTDGTIDNTFQLSEDTPISESLFVSGRNYELQEGHNGNIVVFVPASPKRFSYIIDAEGQFKQKIDVPDGYREILAIEKYKEGYAAIFDGGWPNRTLMYLDSLGNIDPTFTPFDFKPGFSDFQIDPLERIMLILDNPKGIDHNDITSSVFRIDSLGNYDVSLVGISLKGLGTSIIPTNNNGYFIYGSLDSLRDEKLTENIVLVDEGWVIDSSFKPSLNTVFGQNASIHSASLIQPSSLFLVGFNSQFSGQRLIKLNMDGSIDENFTPIDMDADPNLYMRISKWNDSFLFQSQESQFLSTQYVPYINFDSEGQVNITNAQQTDIYTSGTVITAVPVEDHLVIGGDFTHIDEMEVNNLAKLSLSNGTIDSNFASLHGLSANSKVTKIDTTKNRELLVGGFLRFQDSTNPLTLAKFEISGTRDVDFQSNISFNTSFSDPILDYTFINEDSIVFSGDFSEKLVMINANGERISDFNLNSDSLEVARIINVNHFQDEIIISGFRSGSGESRGFVWFLDKSGNFITERPSISSLRFYPQTSGIAENRLLVAGRVWSTSLINYTYQLDLSSNEVDTTSIASFETFFAKEYNGSFSIHSFNENSILLGGSYDNINNSDVSGLAEISFDGQINKKLLFDFNNRKESYIDNTVLLEDSTLLVSGRFTDLNGVDLGSIARIDLTDSCKTIEEQVAKTICKNDTFSFGSQMLTETGEYNGIFQSVFGCDSIVNLSLEVFDFEPQVMATETELSVQEIDRFNYQWFNCGDGTIVDGASEPIYEPSEGDGSWFVRVSLDECFTDSECFSLEKPLSSSTSSQNDLRLSPNPSSGYLTIHLSQISKESNYTIVDLAGKVHLSGSLNDKKVINVAAMPKGIYILKIEHKGTCISEKFTVR